MGDLRITYIGGPTAVLEWGGVRLLTDPTFDRAGGHYGTEPAVLVKTMGPAVGPEAIGPIDAVLLSHDHHADNLDHAGRNLLAGVGQVLTTVAGAARLGGPAVGLAPWQTFDLVAGPGPGLHITATPARHGPPGGDRGPVIGFILADPAAPDTRVYVAGDTVWYEGVAEVARRYPAQVLVLNLGAARVPAVGPAPLTMTAEDGIAAARAFPAARIVPLHFEGWAHFSESREQISETFARAGLADRLHWIAPGATLVLPMN